MADPKPSLFRQPTAATSATATPTPPPEKLDFVGVATMTNGSVYFGEFAQEDDVVTVKIPTAAGDVRTTRRLNRAQIASHRVLDVLAVRKLARIGPHVLAKSDVERVAPEPAADADSPQ